MVFCSYYLGIVVITIRIVLHFNHNWLCIFACSEEAKRLLAEDFVFRYEPHPTGRTSFRAPSTTHSRAESRAGSEAPAARSSNVLSRSGSRTRFRAGSHAGSHAGSRVQTLASDAPSQQRSRALTRASSALGARYDQLPPSAYAKFLTIQ